MRRQSKLETCKRKKRQRRFRILRRLMGQDMREGAGRNNRKYE